MTVKMTRNSKNNFTLSVGLLRRHSFGLSVGEERLHDEPKECLCRRPLISVMDSKS